MNRFHSSHHGILPRFARHGTQLCACVGLAIAALSVSARVADAQLATTIQLPTFGVAVDADGVLTVKTFEDPGGRLMAKRIKAANAQLPADVRADSKLRKVSLVRLEAAVRQKLDADQPLDESMRYLAGLQRLEYVFCYPDKRDVVIAGPAGGWVENLGGRVVGATTGRPVLELQDLLVALRAYPKGRRNRPFVGCTIDPSEDGLARLREFQKTVPRAVSQRARAQVAAKIARGTREALGMSNIRVFGISPNTHFAKVLVEADYRMKRIGIGLEPPPVKMATFLGSLRTARQGMLQRWWFQPDYDCVKVTKDRLGAQLVGQGVQLATEDLAIGPAGQLLNPSARVGQASRMFAQSFTKKYPHISAASPVYAQLRNCIDMLVAAALLQREDYYSRAAWDMETFRSEQALPTQTVATPKQVECLVNVVWKGNRLLAPAGGVTLRPDEALAKDRVIADEDGKLGEQYKILAPEAAQRWWWD